MTILLDFESRSRCDLKRHGGRLYWEHPSTEALCCVLYDTDTGDVGLWLPGDPPPVPPDAELAAHNAMGFDRFAAARVWGVPIDAPWIDTSQLAKRAGLPGKLDALGTRWLGLPKDSAASKFTRGLSTCRRPSGKKNPAAISPADWAALSAERKRELGTQREITPADLARVVDYCASDVEIMAHGWPALESWRSLEPDVEAAERAVNDRGVGFDSELARRLLECDRHNAELALEDVALELNCTAREVATAARSVPQFCAITGAPNAQKETVAALDHPLARAREALASIARGKLEAGLARVSADGRMRDVHNYYGGHTGRWSGRGMQLQNMPRPAKRFESWADDDVCRAADRVLAGHEADADTIDVLLRACIVPTPGNVLVVCDFSGVEARALAWCADDRGALDVFASGRDPYRVAAATIFGVSYDEIPKSDIRRNAGKMAELACGYQGGPDALVRIARSNRVDLESTGADPRAIVDGWRTLHAPIVRFWRACDEAFRAAVCGETQTVDRFTFTPSDDGRDVAIFLPSGRPIVYNDARMVHDGQRMALSYHGTRGIEHIYGGKIVENVIQAMCRDLLADAMVRAEAAGLPVVLHVHDELVCEAPAQAADEALALLHAIMVDLPAWAESFPIGASGHVGRRYRK